MQDESLTQSLFTSITAEKQHIDVKYSYAF